jgi:HK97 family phage major capsid protein
MAFSEMLDQDFSETRYRFAAFDKNAVNEKQRTVALSFSSEAPIDDVGTEGKRYGVEILSHAPGCCDLSRLNNGAPLLLNHDRDAQIGVVESAWIDPVTKHGNAIVRFGEGKLASEIFDDVKAGIRTKVSASFKVSKGSKQADGSLLITAWMPGEISIVPMAGDESIGVAKRSLPAEVVIRSYAPARSQAFQITEMAERIAPQYPALDIARVAGSAIERGYSVDDFIRVALEAFATAAKPVDTTATDVLSDARDFNKYSVSRALLDAFENGGRVTGFAKDVSQEIARQTKREPRGFFIPESVLRGPARALSTSSATSGGFLVATELKTGEFIDLLRNRPVVEKMGCRRLTGLVGNVAIPKLTGAATAYWLPENGTVTESDQVFGQLVLTPHRLVADTAFSKELLAQNSVSTEAIVRDDLNRVSNLALDLAALCGNGANGQPLGVYNTPNEDTQVTFSASATWAKVIAFETAVATANADFGSLGWITSPAVRGKWKGIAKATNYPIFLWENDTRPVGEMGAPEGQVNGYRALVTNQIGAIAYQGNPGNGVIFGNWNDLVLAGWAGVDFVLDPYSLKKSGEIEVTQTQWADVGIRHSTSFVTSADSGAQ